MKSKQIWYVLKASPTKLECAGTYDAVRPTHVQAFSDLWQQLSAQFQQGLLLHLSQTEIEIVLATEEVTAVVKHPMFRPLPEVLELNVAAKGAKKRALPKMAKEKFDLFAAVPTYHEEEQF